MINDLNPYPAMKDSGVPWLGEVPEHWEVLPICALARRRQQINQQQRELLSVYLGRGVVPFSSVDEKRTNPTGEDLSKYQAVEPGDFVLNNQQAWRGSVGVSRYKGIVSPAYLVLALDGRLERAYADRLLFSPAMVSQYLVSSKGVGSIQRNLYWPHLRRVAVLVPPSTEQTAIVRFLNHADRKIRRYIRAKQKLIKLLEEQKQAIIHRAVTRGLDPDVRLKDSGVEWLGDVPEHWEARSFSRISVERADYRGATPEKTDSGVFLVTAKNVRKGWIDYEVSREYVAQKDYDRIMRRGMPKCNDLLLTMEAPLGHVALVDREDIALAQRIVRFRFDSSRIHPRFILLSTLSTYFQNQLICRGTGSTAIGMKASKLPQLLLLLPPLNEQKQILTWIDNECRPLDRVKARAEAEIALLHEYRTRLIADVVTGKLDVREAAAGLPEEAEPMDSIDPDDDLEDLDSEAEEQTEDP